PHGTLLQLVLKNPSRETLAEFQCPASAALAGTTWNTGPLPAGDHCIEATLIAENQPVRLPDISISRIPELPQRLEKLQQAADTLRQQALSATPAPDLPPATLAAAATARSEIALLTAASAGRATEADFPLLTRLLVAEQLAATPQKATDIIAQYRSPQDLWLTLAKGRKSAPVRLRLPAADTAPPGLPVLFVFHGAGGSENMFFETYGAGRTISEATRRGWLVVAPGQGLLGLSLSVSDMLDNLEHFANIDRSQVMLLGHSMGAAQVMRQMQQDPACAQAAAALGGGGRLTTAAAATLKPVRWYVAAGTEDFGRAGAMQLHRSLSAAGVTSEYHDFPNVEHLVIVQAAINDVFRFFDQSLADNQATR
ncbi:MAG: alpha/beta fold hydrolase, partial [Planctomyces sp.]